MLEICKAHLPAVFSNAGPKCERLGYCSEGEKFTYGRYPLKEKVIKIERLGNGCLRKSVDRMGLDT